MIERRIVEKTLINKGWSDDKKYYIKDEHGNKYLLRISNISKYETKLNEFNMMKKVTSLGIPMCNPIEFGTSEEGVYSIQRWIDGVDVRDVIKTLSKESQYMYGLEAGRILKKIHSIPAIEKLESWESRFNLKMDNKINKYLNCPIKFENGDFFINYINEYRHLLKYRPQVFQHGDYHIGNMMLDENKKLFIIDFNHCDYGDPWEEFNRIVWCSQESPMFATGMVNGYFNNDIPIDFWKLLALYISSNTLSSIYWALNYGNEEVDTMIKQATDVLKWYDNMKNYIPSWYEGLN